MSEVSTVQILPNSGKAPRKFGPRHNKVADVTKIKEAVRRTRRSIGTLDDVAAVVRVNKTQLCAYEDDQNPDVHAPVDIIESQVRASGDNSVAEYLLAVSKNPGIVVPLSPVEGCVHALTGRLAEEHGKVLHQLIDALRDGRVDAQEASHSLPSVEALLQIAATVRGRLRQIIEQSND